MAAAILVAVAVPVVTVVVLQVGALVVIVAAAPVALRGDDWPEWRGTGRLGIWTESGILDAFPASGLTVRWRTPVHAGYAGPGVIPRIVTMNRAHQTHYTDSPDPRIEHVLRGWNPDGGPAQHNLTLGDVVIRNVPTDIRSWSGARIVGQPMWLASALAKIDNAAHQIPNPEAERNPATAHMFIINPLSGQGMDNLFATHPSTENRIAALRQLAGQVGGGGFRSAAPQAAPRGPWSGGTRRGPWG